MNRSGIFRLATLGAVFAVFVAFGADLSMYRQFRLGASIASMLKQPGVESSRLAVVHNRPARIEEVDWRPVGESQLKAHDADPVREALLRFYNGELFQIVATYDRDKVEGMSEADMVEVISAKYGAATKPSAEVPYHSNYGETAKVIARWEDSEYSYNLVRTGDRTSFALISSSKRLLARAQTAIAEAKRLDELEAPQRAIALQAQKDQDSQVVLDKARSANKPNFRP